MSTPNPEDQADAVKEALFAGNKIQAIKLYREQTGQGLAESKDAVERLETELRASSPDRFAKAQKQGCSAIILAGAVIGGIVYSFVS